VYTFRGGGFLCTMKVGSLNSPGLILWPSVGAHFSSHGVQNQTKSHEPVLGLRAHGWCTNGARETLLALRRLLSACVKDSPSPEPGEETSVPRCDYVTIQDPPSMHTLTTSNGACCTSRFRPGSGRASRQEGSILEDYHSAHVDSIRRGTHTPTPFSKDRGAICH
jgi:hypothetical protein